MKRTQKRRPYGLQLKVVNARIRVEAYVELCRRAGTRSLGEALDELLLGRERKKAEISLPTPHK